MRVISPRGRLYRVLFATWQYYPVPAGGAEHQAQLQAEELVRRGHQVTVICPKTPGTSSGYVNGVRVRRLPVVNRWRLRAISYFFTLTAFMLADLRRFDIVHVHLVTLHAEVMALVAALYRRPLYLKLASGGLMGEVRVLGRFALVTRYFAMRHAAALQALSPEIAAELLAIGVRPERIRRIGNGVDTRSFGPANREARDDARARLAIPIDVPVVVYLGRFIREKGIDDLLEAWPAVPPPAHLVLVGMRPDRPAEQHVRLPADGSRIIVREWTPSTREYLAATDVFALPSHSEGMSNSLLEAMACGVPSISTRTGAAEVMIEDGVSGLLVDIADVPALGEALRRLVADVDLRHRMSVAARREIERCYSIEAVIDAIEDVYGEVIEAQRQARLK